MDREAWHTAVHGVAKSQTRLNWTFVYLIYISLTIVKKSLGFQGGSEVKKITCQCRRCRWCGFNPWIGKTPWRRAWQSILAWRIPIDRGAWQATVHGVADTTEQLSTHNISGQGWASSSLQWGASLKGGLSSWPSGSQRSLPSSWCSRVHGDSEKAGETWKTALTWQCFPGLA